MGGLDGKKVNGKKRSRNDVTPNAHSIEKRRRTDQINGTLLDLNDDCLLAVFKKLNRIDLCHVQNVNTRFVPLAESAFKWILKRKPDWTQFNMELSRADTRRIFYKFGHLFGTISIWYKIDADMVKRLTQITSLSLVRVSVDSKLIRSIRSSKHLTVLTVFDCKFVGSDDGVNTSRNPSKNRGRKDWPLQALAFYDQLPPTKVFSEFLQYSKQLVCLGLPTHMPDDYIPAILKHGKQLTELNLFNKLNFVSTEIQNLLSHLKNLTKLIVTGCVPGLVMNANVLVEVIKQSAPQLTYLQLRDIIFKRSTLETISEMRSLQLVTLMGTFHCEKTEIVSLVASLPHLSELTLSFKKCLAPECKSRDVNFNVLKGMVEGGQQLSHIWLLNASEIRINENKYEELLEVLKKGNRKKKLSIAIEGCRSTTGFNVPMHLQRTNEKCLAIDYGVDKRCACNSS